MTIHKAKDNSFKLIFNDPSLFAEFLRNYIPIDILNDIQPEDIEDITERFLPLFQDNKDSDTVKRVTLGSNPPLFVIAILEHESGVNHRTSFKMLQYITLVLTDFEKEINKEKANASSAKGFKYPPVLPIVFYDGASKWNAETNFLDKTELNNVFYKYIPQFEYELVNLNEYREYDLIKFGGVLSLIMIIDKINDAGGIGLLSKLPSDYIEKLLFDIPPHLNKLLADVITVLLKRINVPDDEITGITEKLYRREIQEMFAWADNYDVQETRRIAREEGSEEKARQIIIEMKKRNFTEDVIADIIKLPVEKIREIRP